MSSCAWRPSGTGFVAQLHTLDHPGQVASLTLVSTRPVAPGPADPDLPGHAPELMGQLFGRPEPDWADRNSVVDYMTSSARLMSGSVGFNEQDVRAAAGAVFDRAGHTAEAQRASHLGTMFAAIDCRPRWRQRLGEITAPTLVIHGDEDPFFPHRNGVVLASEIPGAALLTLPGIGQGVPRATWPAVADALMRHSDQPAGGSPAGPPARRRWLSVPLSGPVRDTIVGTVDSISALLECLTADHLQQCRRPF